MGDLLASLETQRRLLVRVLERGDAGQLHVRFKATVVDRYRQMEAAHLIRTRSVGRVAIVGRWSIDMGLVAGPDGEAEVHLSVQDLMERLPESGRQRGDAFAMPDGWGADNCHLLKQPLVQWDDGQRKSDCRCAIKQISSLSAPSRGG